MTSILIVDDEPDILELFGSEFQDAGYETHLASNVAAARSVLTNTPIDAILSDVRMPGETGVDLLVWTRQHCTADIVFVIVTGYSDLSLETAFRQGAHGLFHKPVEVGRLLDFTRRCIELKESSAQSRRRSLRVRANSPVYFASANHGLGQTRLEDVGRGGFQFSFQGTPPQPGTELHFRFAGLEPEGAVVSGTCVIRWVRPTRAPDGLLTVSAGAEFLHLDAHSIEPLLDMVTHADLSAPRPAKGSLASPKKP